MNVCSVNDCSRPVKGHGLCTMHYQRMRNSGTTEPPANKIGREPVVLDDVAHVKLSRGQLATIDAADVERVSSYVWFAKWNPCTRSFYAWTNITTETGARTLLAMHRLILGGDADHIDHIGHDTLDNRRSNLRPATRVESMRNRRLRRDNRSGYIGVFPSSRNRWGAHVKVDGRQIRLGSFVDPADAARARDQWIRDNCPSEFWTFNFPLLPGERAIHDPQGATA